ncbi:Uncharacterised protein [Chromobacterium violaceum]|uniref:Uncharacterized protein n=1 Tax=Chromobacterium violaceum TaxID=536 RepID=A0A3S5DLP0_CHRVL|nr:Uncharacterised protein [Chromobacterium violaceum]
MLIASLRSFAARTSSADASNRSAIPSSRLAGQLRQAENRSALPPGRTTVVPTRWTAYPRANRWSGSTTLRPNNGSMTAPCLPIFLTAGIWAASAIPNGNRTRSWRGCWPKARNWNSSRSRAACWIPQRPGGLCVPQQGGRRNPARVRRHHQRQRRRRSDAAQFEESRQRGAAMASQHQQRRFRRPPGLLHPGRPVDP